MSRVGRGQEYPGRLSLCRGRSGCPQGPCRRVSQPGSGRDSCNHCVGGRGATAGDAHDTDRFHSRARPRRARLCSEPRATGPQHHGVHLLRRADYGKMAAVAGGGRSSRHAGLRHLQPRHQLLRPIVYSRDRGRRPDLRDDGGARSGARRRRHRRSHRHPGARARRWRDLSYRQFYHYTSRCDHRCCGPSQFSPNRRDLGISQGWRPNDLLARRVRPGRAGSILHRPDP